MRLRYLHLPLCGPLQQVSVVFGQEVSTFQSSRKGAINFIVGVNGTGKSSLLRALYQTFQALRSRQRPALPVTIAWDRVRGGERVTAVLRATNRKEERSFFALLPHVMLPNHRSSWERYIAHLDPTQGGPDKFVVGADAFTSSLLFAHLPERLLAYTSGVEDLWTYLDHRQFHPKEEEDLRLLIEDERPQGWSIEREWEEEQPNRITNILTRYSTRANVERGIASVPSQFSILTPDTLQHLDDELAPLNEMAKKLRTNQQARNEKLDDAYFRVGSRDLRLAGMTLALWHVAEELRDCGQQQQETLRKRLQELRATRSNSNNARRTLNEIDWFWATHLSFTYRDTEDRVTRRQHEELLCLIALADDVVKHPRGRYQTIMSLGPSDRINLTKKLREAYPSGIPSKALEYIAKRVDGSKTGAEAVIRVFSDSKDLDSTLLDVFGRLRHWERSGLLEHVTLTIKRLPPLNDNETDHETVVTYDQLSDGEQMLLCRAALILILSRQDGSLLLLDEPETHFNDVWKREIVDMVDDGLLRTTEANVIVATHTSIALTDAFAAEVTVLDKQTGIIEARNVSGGLLGSDPGEIAVNLFRAESSIGSRALEYLDQLLKVDWSPDQIDELEAVLATLGSSYHRAELRAILKRLKSANDVTPSN